MFPILATAVCLVYLVGCTSMRLLPPNLRDIGKTKTSNSVRPSEFIFSGDKELASTSGNDQSKWIASMQDVRYLRPTLKKGLIPMMVKGNKLSFLGGNELECTVLEGLDSNAKVELDTSGGAFISFKFPASLPQHDAAIGKIPLSAKLLAHSRIKRLVP